jgi:hypothetical protein
LSNRSCSRLAQVDGDLENGIAYAGSSAGLIREVLPAASIVEGLLEGFRKPKI